MKLIIIILLSLMLFGCNKSNDSDQLNNSVENKVQKEEIKKDYDNQITEKYWKLVLLKDRQIKFNENQKRAAHFILKSQKNEVTGNTGCNQFNGSYELKDESGVTFKPFAVTRRACLEIDYEHEYLKVFEQTKKYEIVKDTLNLFDEANTKLAKFEVVYFD